MRGQKQNRFYKFAKYLADEAVAPWLPRAAVERLEDRTLLSVTGAMFAGPYNVPGTKWTYRITTAQGESANFDITVIGPTVFNGIAATELDETFPSGAFFKTYNGIDPAGNYVTYGEDQMTTGFFRGSQHNVYQPYLTSFPAELTAGIPATFTDTEISTNTETGVVTTTPESHTQTLVTDSTTSVTVPAGIYDVYQVQQTDAATRGTGSDGSSTESDASSTTAYIAAGVGLIKTGDASGGVTELVNFHSNQDVLAFTQQPTDTAKGDTIQPIKVSVEDGTGTVKSIASGTISIAIASGGTGTGSLSGTFIEPLVGGVATFSDLSINSGGDYVFRVTDSATPAVAPTSSTSFKITDTTLDFQTPPADGTANQALRPILVRLLNPQGNLDTTANGTVVTLNPTGFNGANPIRNNTASLVNGVATFNNVILPKAGFYKLQATDAVNDTAVTSLKFKVAGGKLVIIAQPRDGDINTPIPVAVKILNSAGHVDTTATTDVALNLNIITGGVHASLGGTTILAFVGGIARFTVPNAPQVNAAGSYTFTATEEDSSTGALAPTNTTTSVDTRKFKIAGSHLVFVRQPGTTDADVPLVFGVALRDTHNRAVNGTGSIALALTPMNGATGVLSAYTNPGFVGSVDSFVAGTSPSINSPGKYKLTATQLDANGVVVDNTASADSRIFSIKGLRIEFLQQPTDTAYDAGIGFKVAIVNSHGQVDTAHDSSIVSITSSLPGLGYSQTNFIAGKISFPTEVVDILGQGNGAVTNTNLGTGTLTVGATDSSGVAIPEIAPATSRRFNITPLHIVFANQPINSTIDGAVPFKLTLEDSKNQIDRQQGAYVEAAQVIALTATPQGGIGYSLSGFTDGVHDYPAATTNMLGQGSGAVTLTHLGIYKITAAVEVNGVTVTNILPATSRSFKILNQHLVFERQPVDIGVGFPIPFFQVASEDADNQIVTGGSRTIQISYEPTAGGHGTPPVVLGTAVTDPSTGLATFSLFYIPTPGTYHLIATDASGGGGAGVARDLRSGSNHMNPRFVSRRTKPSHKRRTIL